MDDFKDSVMIALLPTSGEWCSQPLPHLTLVFAGTVSDLPASTFNEMAKEVTNIASLSDWITLKVSGVDQFGDGDNRVDVMTLEASQQLLAMRDMVEQWNASEFPFSPHVTCGPVGSAPTELPLYLAFDRISVVWGTEAITFWLRK